MNNLFLHSLATCCGLALSLILTLALGATKNPAVEQGDPEPARRAMPRYPVRAMEHGQDGEAVIEATVDNAGNVAEARVLSETPIGQGFGDAALDALRQYVFKPGRPGIYTTTNKFHVGTTLPQSNEPIITDWAHPKPAPMPAVYVPPVYPKRRYGDGIEGYADLVFVVGYAGEVIKTVMVTDRTSDTAFGTAVAEAMPFWNFGSMAPGAYEMRVDFNKDTLARGIVKLDQVRWRLDRPPKDLHIPQGAKLPAYPAEAQTAHAHGSAQIMVELDDGKPQAVEVAQESPGGVGFGVAAAAAVLQWQFEPDLRDGVYSIFLHF